MAKKNQKLSPLTLQEIILRGDADTIRQALEARVQIDGLLEEREAAYRRISELEQQVEEIVGEESVFPFPEPPIPVASFDTKPAPKRAPAPKPEATTEAAPEAKAPSEDTIETPTDETSKPEEEDPKEGNDA